MIYDSILTSFLADHGFRKIREVNEGQTHFTEYTSGLFSITIEQYRRDIYTILSKEGTQDDGIALYNLLEFLNNGQKLPIENTFYHDDGAPLDEVIGKQIEKIVLLLRTYFSQIEDFFLSPDYLSKRKELRDFVIARNPNLFRQK